MSVDRRTVKLLAIVLLWAGLARAAILHWSPYPATLDGFFYVRSVELVGATGHVPTPIDWDRTAMTAFLATVREVLGTAPLRLLQPLSAVLGLGPVLIAVVLLRRLLGTVHGVSAGGTRVGVALTGGVLAVEGLFVRRSGVPDEELLGLLFVPLVAYTFHRWLQMEREEERERWAVLTVVVLIVLPMTHSLSTVVALLVLGVVGVVHTAAGWRPAVGTSALAGVLFGLACAVGYYSLALVSPALTRSYTDRLLASPRLLGAWCLLLGLGVVWFVRTSARIQRVVVGANLLAWIGLLGANLRTPIYVGTVPTPPILLALILPLTALVVAAALGIDRVANRHEGGAAVLGLFAAPVVLVDYFLTAGLSPDLFDAMLRVQTFAHVPVAIMAGAFVATRFTGGVGATVEWRRFGRAAFVLVLLGAVATAPLSVMALDAATIPGTTTPQAFAGAGFTAAHVNGTWASDDQVRRVGGLYYSNSADIEPVARWARDGPSPDVPVLATPAWTDRGIHQYPRPPAQVDENRFDEWRATGQVVYTTGGPGTDGRYFLVVSA
jgi:hypothetical protein